MTLRVSFLPFCRVGALHLRDEMLNVPIDFEALYGVGQQRGCRQAVSVNAAQHAGLRPGDGQNARGVFIAEAGVDRAQALEQLAVAPLQRLFGFDQPCALAVVLHSRGVSLGPVGVFNPITRAARALLHMVGFAFDAQPLSAVVQMQPSVVGL